MTNEMLQKQIDEDRAAVLLGFTPAQLGLLREQSGLGRRASVEGSQQRWFTYQELCQLCRKVARATS
jgi:hypothetical protein